MMTDRNGTKHVLPGAISDRFRTLVIEMRKRPYPVVKGGEETLVVSEGLATVMNAGEAEVLEEGMMFSLVRRTVSARRIEVKEGKFRGSNNHHKFLVIVHDGRISGVAA